MKKIYSILLVVAAAAALVSCAKDNAVKQEKGKFFSFKATSEVSTKTSLFDPSTVIWTTGDKIAVVPSDKNENNEFTIGTGGGSTAEFTGTIATASADGNYYAFYPRANFIKLDTGNNKIQFNIPQQQTAELNTFASGTAPAIAYASSTPGNFSFINLAAFVYFDLQVEHVKKITFENPNTGSTDAIAAGTAKVTYDGTTLTYTDNPGTKYYSVELSNGGTELPKGKYYLVLFPNDRTNKQLKMSNGFKVTLTNMTDQEASKSSSNSLVVARGAAKNLGTLAAADFTFGNTLSVDKETVNVTAAAGTYDIHVTSSFSWTAASDNSEFTISPTSGTNNGTITVTYSANTSTTATRSANITLKSDDIGVPDVVVAITQAKAASASTLFAFTVGSATVAEQTATGGSVVFGHTSKFEASTVSSSGYAYKLDGDPGPGNYKYALPVLGGGNKFAVGDKINITIYAGSNPKAGQGLQASTDLAGTDVVYTALTTLKNTEETFSYTVKAGDSIIGKDRFYITRISESIYFTSITIER